MKNLLLDHAVLLSLKLRCSAVYGHRRLMENLFHSAWLQAAASTSQNRLLNWSVFILSAKYLDASTTSRPACCKSAHFQLKILVIMYRDNIN